MKAAELKRLLYETFGHLTDEKLLALTIYGEARGELEAGKIAVGSVILERVEHRNWDGKTIREVCLMPYQFSCYLPGDPNFPILKKIAADPGKAAAGNVTFRLCSDVAAGLLSGSIPRNPLIQASHCCQYLTPFAKAGVDWWKTMNLVATIDHHEFYA